MESQSATEDANSRAAEQEELESIWKDLVTCVLSNTRLDPKYKGQAFQPFLSHKGEVSPEQVTALQRSDYGRSFKEFARLRSHLPEADRPKLYEVAEVYKMLSISTLSLYRGIQNKERTKAIPNELELLSEAAFLPVYPWQKDDYDFNVMQVEERLNEYIDLQIEWQRIDRALLKMCVSRAYWEEAAKAKSLVEELTKPLYELNPWIGAAAHILMNLIGVLFPVVLWGGVNVAVLVWILGHIQTHDTDVWVVFGVLFVAISIPSMVIHYGITEARHLLHRIAEPGWQPYKKDMDPDLLALNRAVNRFASEHINLRLVREQLVRLQRTSIEIPVQLITLIDRSIAQGKHHW